MKSKKYILITIICIIFILLPIFDEYIWNKNCISSKARVIETSISTDAEGENTYTTKYEFYANNQIITATTSKAFEKGAEILVKYNAKNPQKSIVDNERYVWVPGDMLSFLGFFIVYMEILFILSGKESTTIIEHDQHLKVRNKDIKIAKYGLIISSIIVCFSLLIIINNQKVYLSILIDGVILLLFSSIWIIVSIISIINERKLKKDKAIYNEITNNLYEKAIKIEDNTIYFTRDYLVNIGLSYVKIKFDDIGSMEIEEFHNSDGPNNYYISIVNNKTLKQIRIANNFYDADNLYPLLNDIKLRATQAEIGDNKTYIKRMKEQKSAMKSNL